MDASSQVAQLIKQASQAQRQLETYDQAAVDELVTAAAWALVNPTNNQILSELAVAETELGNVADKITKNHRKTLGLLRDLKDAKTVGVIRRDPEQGIVEIARPVGIVGAIVPSTNPIATPMNMILNALKCRNAIILSPSPKGQPSCTRLIELIYLELDRIGAPRNLVQALPHPVTKDLSMEMLKQVDLVVVTGSQNNVKAAYTCGTPAFGVGAGNVTSLIDETADLVAAAAKIKASKTFDNATSCSSENSLVIVDAIYNQMLEALDAVNACLLTPEETASLQSVLWHNGHLNAAMLAKPVATMCELAGITRKAACDADFLMVEETGVGHDFPFSGEKMSLVLSLYRAQNFDHAKQVASDILNYQGKGHSLSLHSQSNERAEILGLEMPVCRVIVNQAHCFAAGGSFDNGLPFSLSMGCGTWGGNVTDQNVHYRHFMNVTKVVQTIPAREVSVEDMFAEYQRRYLS
tara:strand:- start:1810 stop:3207 length:1398 start_codon:yes stop_codon:yes gene_type:complete